MNTVTHTTATQPKPRKIRVPWQQVDTTQLSQLTTPDPQGPRHNPLPHIVAYEIIKKVFRMYGLETCNEEIWVQHSLSGKKPVDQCLMKMTIQGEGEHRRLIGVRNSNDQRTSLQYIVALVLMVCSNGIFKGDTKPFSKKHTNHIKDTDELYKQIFWEFQSILESFKELEDFIKMLKACAPITKYESPSMVYDINSRLQDAVLPKDKFEDLVKLTQEPPHEEFAPNTIWSCHNAYTELLKSDNNPNKSIRSRYINDAFESHIQDNYETYLGYAEVEPQDVSFSKIIESYS